MQLKPWLPKELTRYPVARKVLGVLAPVEPDAQGYKVLHRQKVISLIKKAKDLEPIKTYLNLPLEALNNPKDPEQVYQDLEDLAPEWRTPVHDLIMSLKNKTSLKEVFQALNLGQEEKSPPLKFREELEDLTLEEFLSLAV